MKYLFGTVGIISLMLVLVKTAMAQEQLVPLHSNPALSKPQSASGSVRTAVSLPFSDDFSYPGHLPNPNLWIDHQAFVNTTFPLNPPSIGVATLDGLDQFGQPYDSTSYSFSSIGGADTLTSQPILLGSLTSADNVFLSFYYQPGGLGDKPNDSAFNSVNYGFESGDSLILEFKDQTGTWRHIWGSDGFSSNQFYQEIFQLTDPSFFHDDFQFRFRNIATLTGQYDCWNIDYVKLGSGRTPGDTILSDVAIQYLPSSILKNYELMPWNQFQNFQSTEKASTIALTVKNNFNIGKNTSRQMTANETTTSSFIYDSGVSSDNFDPGESKILGFDSFDIPNFDGDSIVIATSFAISATGGSGNTDNDSVTRYQVFSNEMAYDDGTAEAAYRLTGSPAAVALEYHLNTPDTLRGIEILFAHTEVNLSSNLFNLTVWKSLSVDNDTLIRDEFQLPKFENEENGFAFYRLSRPIAVSDTFYIGWFQVSLQTDYKMDIGFDKNDTADQHLFYNVDGTWQQSELPGAAMMRPVLGNQIPFGVGVPDVKSQDDVTLFPNPASDVLYVRNASNFLKVEILDNAGRVLKSEEQQSAIDIHQLSAGFYFLRLTDLKTGKISVHKFIKS